MIEFESFESVPSDFTGECYVSESQVIVKYKNGKYHCEDGTPAIIDKYSKGWYKNGLGHNLLGPAVHWENGKKIYAVEGVILSKEAHSNHPLVINHILNEILEL